MEDAHFYDVDDPGFDPKQALNRYVQGTHVKGAERLKWLEDKGDRRHGQITSYRDYFAIKATSSSKDSDTVDQSNYTCMKEDFPWLEDVGGQLGIHVEWDEGDYDFLNAEEKLGSIDDDSWENFKEAIRGLDNYPLYNEDHHSELEHKLLTEWWDEDGAKELRTELIAQQDSAFLAFCANKMTEDELWGLIGKYDAWETHNEGGNVFISNNQLERLAERVEADDLTQFEDWVEGRRVERNVYEQRQREWAARKYRCWVKTLQKPVFDALWAKFQTDGEVLTVLQKATPRRMFWVFDRIVGDAFDSDGDIICWDEDGQMTERDALEVADEMDRNQILGIRHPKDHPEFNFESADRLVHALLEDEDDIDEPSKGEAFRLHGPQPAEWVAGDNHAWTYGGAYVKDDVLWVLEGADGNLPEIWSHRIEVPEELQQKFRADAERHVGPNDPNDPDPDWEHDVERVYDGLVDHWQYVKAEELEAAQEMRVYRCCLDDIDYNGWPDRDDVQELIDEWRITWQDWENLPLANKWYEIGQHFGWEELDPHPDRFTKAELEAILKVKLR